MKNIVATSIIVLSFLISFSMSSQSVSAHGGGLDGSNGHNCRTGPCAGTYHYHWGGDKSVEYSTPGPSSSPDPQPQQQTQQVAPAPQPVAEPSPVITYSTDTETEAIKFKTEKEDDETLTEGEEKVSQKGVNGTKTITYSLTLTDGVETNREKTNEEVTKKPVNEIILVGAKKPEEPKEIAEETEPEEEPEEVSDLAAAVTLGVMGYGGYRGVKAVKKKVGK